MIALLVGLATVAPAGVAAVFELAAGIALFVPLAAVGAAAFVVLRSGPERARGWVATGLALLGLGACAMPFVPNWICGGMALPLGTASLLAARTANGPAIVWAAFCGVAALVLGSALLAGMFSGHLIDLAEREAPVLLGAMALMPIAAIGFILAAGLDAAGQRREQA